VVPIYELFDHTADMGIRVRAATLAELLKPAADGLYAVIGELVTTGEAAPLTVELEGTDPSVLLRDFLTRLLILFECDGRQVVELDGAVFDERRLSAIAHAAAVDAERSVYLREVKAVTYHELGIRPIAGGYEATFIVDI